MRYDDPDGGTRHCVNSEIADLAIEVYERRDWGWARTGVLTSTGGAHFELGQPAAHPGLPDVGLALFGIAVAIALHWGIAASFWTGVACYVAARR